MSIINIILIGIGLAMDAFAVTIAKSLSLKNIRPLEIVSIAGMFGLFQGLMPLIGWLSGVKFQIYITAFDHWIAFILLSIIGGKMIYESFEGKETDSIKKEVAVTSIKNRFSFKSLLVLSIATSIDALAVGVSFAFLNVPIIPSSIIISLITFTLCIIAVYVGKIFGNVIEKKAELLGGVTLILIGLKILLEHIL